MAVTTIGIGAPTQSSVILWDGVGLEKIMKKLVVGLLFFLLFSDRAFSQECTSRLQSFVNKTGYTLIVAKPCKVWVATDALSIPRGEGVTGLLLLAQEGEMGVVGAVVQSKANLHLTADLLQKLMKMNNSLDYVKVGIDDDGDLFVRSELQMESVTAEEFSAVVKKVVEASTKTYDALKE